MLNIHKVIAIRKLKKKAVRKLWHPFASNSMSPFKRCTTTYNMNRIHYDRCKQDFDKCSAIIRTISSCWANFTWPTTLKANLSISIATNKVSKRSRHCGRCGNIGYYQTVKCAKSGATYLRYYSLLSERHLHSACGFEFEGSFDGYEWFSCSTLWGDCRKTGKYVLYVYFECYIWQFDMHICKEIWILQT